MNAYEVSKTLTTMAFAGKDGTVDSWDQPLPEAGFYVGGVRPSLVYKDVNHVDRSDLAWFIGGTEARYFGVWVDSEDGQIYFDAVTHVEKLQDAVALGNEREEVAIWDIAENEEVRLQDA